MAVRRAGRIRRGFLYAGLLAFVLLGTLPFLEYGQIRKLADCGPKGVSVSFTMPRGFTAQLVICVPPGRVLAEGTRGTLSISENGHRLIRRSFTRSELPATSCVRD
ncbi:MAG TPA: hypothetical protein VGN26_23690, partial [Armatimonadota bacterium]